ncbi:MULTISPECIES: BTAD domain-containing putative transcriptional regulator [unclassified Blastococcus]
MDPVVPEPGALAVRVLGGLTAERDGADVDLGGPRQRGVLALLLLARGASVPAQRLVDLLWGDAAPPSATAALHSYVSHLRRALEPGRGARERGGLLVRDRVGYAVRLSDDAVDAWRFERLVGEGVAAPAERAAALLTEALALYRGEAYAEWAGQQWADAESARLAELRAVATERLLAARLQTEDAAVLVPRLEALAAEEPLREERWRLLALALYRTSRQSDALAALRRARTVLARELGVDPSRALRDLEAQILAHDPALAGPAARPPAAPAAAPAPAAVSAAPPAPAPAPAPGRAAAGPGRPAGEDIVDRDAELRRLQSCVTDALAGQGLVALIEGPAGIGKSRLLTEARRMGAAGGAPVLAARGSALEREFGYGAVRQLFEPLLVDPARRARLLGGPAAAAASVFDAPADAGPAVAEQRADASFAVLHALYWLVVDLTAEGPVVLAVDDLQWCDSASLRFLAYLVRRLEGLPVLLAATLRTGEPPADPTLVDEIAHDPATVAVQPGPLSREGVEDLVRRRLGDDAAPDFVAACARTTGGNPLLLRQLLRALEADGVRPDRASADTVTAIGSRAVSSIVLMRLGRMDEAAGAVARAVAVLGDGAAIPVVASLAGLAEDAAARAVDRLAEGEILRDDLPLGFVHPLVRDAVYRSLPPGQRELAHARAARVLADSGASAEQVAAHLLQVPARGEEWAVEALHRAAAIAADRGAPESAVPYLVRVLDELATADDRAQTLLQLGLLETLTDGLAAITHLRQAHALAQDVAVRAQIAVVLAHTLIFAGPRGEATAFATAAAADLPEELVDVRQALRALARVGGYMHGVDPAVWGAEPAGEPVGTGPGARMLAVATAWELVVGNRDLPRCVELAHFGLADGVLQAADPGLFWVIAPFILDMADEDMEPFWDAALTDAHERGSLFAALATHLWRGHAQWWRGDLPEAEQSLRTANEQSARWAAPAVGISYGEAFLVWVLLDRGDTAAARAFLESVRWRNRIGDGSRLNLEAEVGVLLAERRPEQALALLDAHHLEVSAVANPVWAPWRSLRAQALTALGRREEAVALMTEEAALARAWGARRWVGRTLWLLGEARGEAGAADLREAVRVLSGTQSRLDLARAQAALARLVPAEEAAPLLRSALELAEDCGAEGVRAQVAATLTAAGLAVPPPRPATRRLTATERRVAAMAAEGADARQIAASLFLTPRTVEVTLAGVRAALGAATDADLRVALSG